jgi:prepilin-type N-terminal cleavage/methylation domain-containing protein
MNARRRQAGFTLIELMIALAISSILVLMVLGVFSRMSSAYRRQQQIASLQVVLSAAQNLIAQDARQAGYQMSEGFRLASAPTILQRPVQIINNSTVAGVSGDEARFFSADGSVQARVVTMQPGVPTASLTVDANPFLAPEIAVIVNTGTKTVEAGLNPGDDTRSIATFTACVVRVTPDGGIPNQLNVDTNPPWGIAGNPHCDAVRDAHNNSGPTLNQTMIYRFRSRGYRVFARSYVNQFNGLTEDMNVLQLSPSGTLVANDWQDLGIGFTDLQLAARIFTATDGDGDTDGDGNIKFDWYSGAAMQGNTSPIAVPVPPNTAPFVTRLTVSLAIRTDRSVDGVASTATPAFIVAGNVNFNDLGDRPSVAVPVDGNGNPIGNRIYRFSTNRIDMRNTGAGL